MRLSCPEPKRAFNLLCLSHIAVSNANLALNQWARPSADARPEELREAALNAVQKIVDASCSLVEFQSVYASWG